MFCPKCGNEIQVGARFCGKCGAVLSGGRQEQQKECAENSRAGNRPTGAETLAQVKETGKKLGTGLGKWLKDYMDTWRGLGKLGGRERSLWLGIHGGAVFLLVCILIVGFAVSGGNTAGTAKLNAEKLLQEVTEDGDITEEEVLSAAEQIHSYADWAKLEETYYEKDFFKEASSHIGLNFPRFVADQCRDESAVGMLIEQYGQWYDRDGLTEKITEKSDPVQYVFISDGMYTIIPEENVEEDTFRTDSAGNYISVMWYAYPDSDEITFVKTVSGETETAECYSGKYEIAEKELVIRLDGEEYHLSQATTDLANREQELFANMAGGTWKFEQGFYDMIAANLGDWEKYSVDERDTEPLYIVFTSWRAYRGLRILGVDGINLEQVKGYAYEQGEGKTVTFFSQSSSLTVSYDKRGDDLIITVNGTEYVLSPKTVVDTGTYDMWGGRNN